MLDTLLLRLSLHFTQLHFTPLHYTCRHFTSPHLNFTKLHFTTLSFGLTPFKFPTAPFHLASLHFTSLHFTSPHFTSLHYTFRWFSPHLYFFHFTPFIIAFLTLFLKTFCTIRSDIRRLTVQPDKYFPWFWACPYWNQAAVYRKESRCCFRVLYTMQCTLCSLYTLKQDTHRIHLIASRLQKLCWHRSKPGRRWLHSNIQKRQKRRSSNCGKIADNKSLMILRVGPEPDPICTATYDG